MYHDLVKEFRDALEVYNYDEFLAYDATDEIAERARKAGWDNMTVVEAYEQALTG